jgi:hypothetical protein
MLSEATEIFSRPDGSLYASSGYASLEEPGRRAG